MGWRQIFPAHPTGAGAGKVVNQGRRSLQFATVAASDLGLHTRKRGTRAGGDEREWWIFRLVESCIGQR